MTQNIETAVEPPDELKKLLGELTVNQSRLVHTPPSDLRGLALVVGNTVLEYIKDLATQVVQLRDETNQVLDELYDNMATPDGGIDPEDREKFKALAQGVDFLIVTVTGLGIELKPEVTGSFEKLRALSAECLQLLEGYEAEDAAEGDETEEDEAEEVNGAAS